MIISADNPLSPFVEIYNTRTKQPVRNVLSYDTITGEGVVAGTKTKVLPHLGNIISTEVSFDDIGAPVKAYFKNSNDLQVRIKIPQLSLHRFHRYISEIMTLPEHINSEKIIVEVTSEYIDRPDKHVSS